MKNIKVVLLSIFLMIGIMSCSKDDEVITKNELLGTWIEKIDKDILLYNQVSDTLVFNNNMLVSKHFYYDSWKYTIDSNFLFFEKNDKIDKYLFELISENEIVIYNFIDGTLTNEVKNIHFIKK